MRKDDQLGKDQRKICPMPQHHAILINLEWSNCFLF